jgi:hypothetical protein
MPAAVGGDPAALLKFGIGTLIAVLGDDGICPVLGRVMLGSVAVCPIFVFGRGRALVLGAAFCPMLRLGISTPPVFGTDTPVPPMLFCWLFWLA